jgi:hypothetical protein
MNIYYKFIFILLIWLQYSCNSKSNNNCNDNIKVLNDTLRTPTTDSFDPYSLLISQMTDTITLYRLLDQITHQEKVKVIAKLNTTWDDEKNVTVYANSNYVFQLRNVGFLNFNDHNSNTIFTDGNFEISFKDYNITCYQDTLFRCEDYGFNLDNTLNNPQIIEVCGKRFLYSDVLYWCNGIGCGCFLTFIYDLETHKPTFIENYRIPYNGFFVSDFNNDNSPDLLVISRTSVQKMKGFDFEDFEIRLTPFSYKKGIFKPHFDGQYQRIYGYELYSFTNGYHHSYHDSRIYSITKDNWFRQ